MKENMRKILSILLVITLVIGTGFYSYGGEDPEEPIEPGDPEEPGESGDPEEPGEPGDPEEPGEPEEPILPEEPEIIEEDPAIEVVVTPDKTSYTVGKTIYYSITISNTGNVDLEDVDYADELIGGEKIGELPVEQEVEIKKEYEIPLDYEEGVITNIV